MTSKQVASSFSWFINTLLYLTNREDELFCTHSASSPLPLVTSGFGVEVASSLHNLEVENDIVKLSGYISGPCNTVYTKVIHISNIKSQSYISSYPYL